MSNYSTIQKCLLILKLLVNNETKNVYFLCFTEYHWNGDVITVAVVTMSKGQPAQDQQNFVLTSKFFIFFFLDTVYIYKIKVKNSIRTSNLKFSFRGLLLLSVWFAYGIRNLWPFSFKAKYHYCEMWPRLASDCCLTHNEKFFTNTIARTSYIQWDDDGLALY